MGDADDGGGGGGDLWRLYGRRLADVVGDLLQPTSSAIGYDNISALSSNVGCAGDVTSPASASGVDRATKIGDCECGVARVENRGMPALDSRRAGSLNVDDSCRNLSVGNGDSDGCGVAEFPGGARDRTSVERVNETPTSDADVLSSDVIQDHAASATSAIHFSATRRALFVGDTRVLGADADAADAIVVGFTGHPTTAAICDSPRTAAAMVSESAIDEDLPILASTPNRSSASDRTSERLSPDAGINQAADASSRWMTARIADPKRESSALSHHQPPSTDVSNLSATDYGSRYYSGSRGKGEPHRWGRRRNADRSCRSFDGTIPSTAMRELSIWRQVENRKSDVPPSMAASSSSAANDDQESFRHGQLRLSTNGSDSSSVSQVGKQRISGREMSLSPVGSFRHPSDQPSAGGAVRRLGAVHREAAVGPPPPPPPSMHQSRWVRCSRSVERLDRRWAPKRNSSASSAGSTADSDSCASTTAGRGSGSGFRSPIRRRSLSREWTFVIVTTEEELTVVQKPPTARRSPSPTVSPSVAPSAGSPHAAASAAAVTCSAAWNSCDGAVMAVDSGDSSCGNYDEVEKQPEFDFSALSSSVGERQADDGVWNAIADSLSDLASHLDSCTGGGTAVDEITLSTAAVSDAPVNYAFSTNVDAATCCPEPSVSMSNFGPAAAAAANDEQCSEAQFDRCPIDVEGVAVSSFDELIASLLDIADGGRVGCRATETTDVAASAREASPMAAATGSLLVTLPDDPNQLVELLNGNDDELAALAIYSSEMCDFESYDPHSIDEMAAIGGKPPTGQDSDVATPVDICVSSGNSNNCVDDVIGPSAKTGEADFDESCRDVCRDRQIPNENEREFNAADGCRDSDDEISPDDVMTTVAESVAIVDSTSNVTTSIRSFVDIVIDQRSPSSIDIADNCEVSPEGIDPHNDFDQMTSQTVCSTESTTSTSPIEESGDELQVLSDFDERVGIGHRDLDKLDVDDGVSDHDGGSATEIGVATAEDERPLSPIEGRGMELGRETVLTCEFVSDCDLSTAYCDCQTDIAASDDVRLDRNDVDDDDEYYDADGGGRSSTAESYRGERVPSPSDGKPSRQAVDRTRSEAAAATGGSGHISSSDIDFFTEKAFFESLVSSLGQSPVNTLHIYIRF
jgi:hypothetical protein